MPYNEKLHICSAYKVKIESLLFALKTSLRVAEIIKLSLI